jgi:hypothetical protein
MTFKKVSHNSIAYAYNSISIVSIICKILRIYNVLKIKDFKKKIAEERYSLLQLLLAKSNPIALKPATASFKP